MKVTMVTQRNHFDKSSSAKIISKAVREEGGQQGLLHENVHNDVQIMPDTNSGEMSNDAPTVCIDEDQDTSTSLSSPGTGTGRTSRSGRPLRTPVYLEEYCE
jgi:hypothetical protein